VIPVFKAAERRKYVAHGQRSAAVGYIASADPTPHGRKKRRFLRPYGATYCAVSCSHGGAALAVGYILPPLRGS